MKDRHELGFVVDLDFADNKERNLNTIIGILSMTLLRKSQQGCGEVFAFVKHALVNESGCSIYRIGLQKVRINLKIVYMLGLIHTSG